MLANREPASVRLTGIGDEAGPALPDQIAAMHRLGWVEIELRTIDGVPIGELDENAYTRVHDSVRHAGLSVVCLASRIGSWARPITASFDDDLAELDVLARRCNGLGTRYIRIMSYPNDGMSETDWRREVVDRVRRLTEIAERSGIVLLHENCSGWAGASAERALQLLETVDSPSLRLLFDTGNGIEHGYPAYDMLRELVGHVEHVHIKDAIRTEKGPAYTAPGEGQCHIADCLRLLLEAGYSGAFSLEPHLATLPHLGRSAGIGALDSFVQAGRNLERLLPHSTESNRDFRTGEFFPDAQKPDPEQRPGPAASVAANTDDRPA